MVTFCSCLGVPQSMHEWENQHGAGYSRVFSRFIECFICGAVGGLAAVRAEHPLSCQRVTEVFCVASHGDTSVWLRLESCGTAVTAGTPPRSAEGD